MLYKGLVHFDHLVLTNALTATSLIYVFGWWVGKATGVWLVSHCIVCSNKWYSIVLSDGLDETGNLHGFDLFMGWNKILF